VIAILDRHRDEAGIIYCIRRLDVDEMCANLKAKGYAALPYHAGLPPEERAATQEAFLNERCDLVVATVAFGMGIDRANIRFVLHAGMPKSIEHYQQEAGRAGRDGQPAECVLLYSGRDFMTWKALIEKSAQEFGAGPEVVSSMMEHIEDINRYCRSAVCRHRLLVEHFGQPFARTECEACDVCLGEIAAEPDSQIIAQKILSCVARVEERFGVGHVTLVLAGEVDERIERLGHDRLTTFGILKNETKKQIRDWIRQLVGQQLLDQVGAEYPVLKLNAASWEVMRSQRPARLARLARKERKERIAAAPTSWEGVDAALFGALRRLRRQIAEEIKKPPYVVFNDATLREMARLRPTTPEKMLRITGVGDVKLRAFGERFLEVIRAR